jgi:hypothetical protein
MTTEKHKITRDDLEAKFRELKDDVDETTETAKSYAAAAAVAVGLVIFAVAFAAGRKRGRRKSTVVEIRRI